MTQLLNDKSILITGAGSGIGRATALTCAAHGARLTLADINLDATQATAAQVQEQGGQAVACQVDVRDAAQVDQMVAAAIEANGRLDGAFNNAGILGPTDKRLADYDEDEWQQVMDINLKGVWLCIRAEVKQMLQQGQGSIVNTASVAGLVGSAGLSLYSTSKHGVVGLTRSAALQYGGDGLRVNAVCPGYVDTPMLQDVVQNDREFMERLNAASPLNRVGQPQEIGEAVAWLLSDAASFVTGVSFPVDGAYTAK